MTGEIAIVMDERQKRQRARNRALLVVLLALVAVFYVLAMVRTGARDYAVELRSGALTAELSDMVVRYLLRNP